MVECLLIAQWIIGSIPHCGPIELFLYQPVFHKGYGMCYPISGMVHIKDPVLLIRKSNPCSGDSGFPFPYLNGPIPLFTSIYMYINVSSASLNKALAFFQLEFYTIHRVVNHHIQVNSVLTCTFRASCHSTHVSWAHTPVII